MLTLTSPSPSPSPSPSTLSFSPISKPYPNPSPNPHTPSLVAALLSARTARRQGIRAIPASERSEILTEIGLHRHASLDLAEQEISEHRMMAVQAVHVPRGEELRVPEIPPFSDHESVGIVDLWS